MESAERRTAIQKNGYSFTEKSRSFSCALHSDDTSRLVADKKLLYKKKQHFD